MSRARVLLLVAVASVGCTVGAGILPAAGTTPVPTVNLVLPKSGSVLGGTKVAVVGTNLTGASAVAFGTSSAASFTVDSDSSITAVAPPGSAGTVDITVTTPGGTSQASSADQFTYVTHAPTVSSIMPSAGPVTGGTKVKIIGTNLGSAQTVDFGTTAATAIKQVGGNEVIATSPPGPAGTVDVTVTTPQGTSSVSTADEFTYMVHAPVVRLVLPNRGDTGGGTTVTILGSNFHDVSSVDFGTTPAASFNVNSRHQITAQSPPGSATVDITVTTDQGTSVVSPKDVFAYGFPAPAVSQIVPTSGTALGGTRVTVVGTNLVGTSAVDFGGVPATRFTVNSDTSVTATAPPGTGVVDITVTTPEGTSTTSPADQFTYIVRPPVVKSIVPASGSAGGGTTVTIVGANFQDASAVLFGSNPATTFQVDTSHAITATSPAGSGTVDITVITPQGTSAAIAADQFTYQ